MAALTIFIFHLGRERKFIVRLGNRFGNKNREKDRRLPKA